MSPLCEIILSAGAELAGTPELDMGPFLLIQSNSIQKWLVLKLTRNVRLMCHYLS